MRNRCAIAVVVLTSLFASGPWRRIDAAEGWQAGVASANITPQQSMWMSGYASRNHGATGKLTDLWAKALVLQDAQGNRGALVTLDLVGIDRALANAICLELKREFGLERRQIVLAASHTHTGPVVGRNLTLMGYAKLPQAERQRIDDYAAQLQEHVVGAVGQAIAGLRPGRLLQGTGTATFAVNRRNNPEADAPKLRAARALRGPVDHDVPVLAIRAEDDKLVAVVFGYACHATVLSDYNWSGDYPGFAMAELEALYPGCQAMFWAGCGADQNPLPRRTVEHARHYGRRLANAVDETLISSQMDEVAPTLQTSFATIDLEFAALPSQAELAASAESSDVYEQARAQFLLTQLQDEGALAKTYPYPVGMWKLGKDLRWVSLGGEVVVDYALRLKSEFAAPLWVTAYANDVMAYIPSRRVLSEGGYEGGGAMVYYGLPSTWSSTVEEAIVGEVRRQAEAR